MSNTVTDEEIAKAQKERLAERSDLMGFNKAGGYDTDVYDSDRFSGYANSIGPEDDDEPMTGRKSSSQNAKPKKHTGGIREEYLDKSNDSSNPFARDTRARRIDDDYRERRLNRGLSPERADPFAANASQQNASSYADIMAARNNERREASILAAAKKKKEEEEEAQQRAAQSGAKGPGSEGKKRRWDDVSGGPNVAVQEAQKKPKDNTENWGETPAHLGSGAETPSRFAEATPGRFDNATPGRFNATPIRPAEEGTPYRGDGFNPGSRWDATPQRVGDATPARGRWDATPAGTRGDATPARGRWDATPARGDATPARGRWESTPSRGRWDATPARGDATPARGGGRWDATPARTPSRWDATPARDQKSSRWDSVDATPGRTPGMTPGMTPLAGSESGFGGAAPTPRKKKNRWDETPVQGATPMVGATPMSGYGMTPGMTPMGGMGMATPMMEQTPEALSQRRAADELNWRNRPLTDEDLDALLPSEEDGYTILEPPPNYKPLYTPGRVQLGTPTPGMTPGFQMQSPMVGRNNEMEDIPTTDDNMPIANAEDRVHFAKLLEDVDEEGLTSEEMKERKILSFLLKVKNGTPPQRKTALRHLTEKARWFGPGPLFNSILPLLMSPNLEDQERHLLVKVIDRVLYKLDDLVRPYVHKILVVIEPLLIDTDYYARVEGREIISNLAKAAGLAAMTAVMRPDIDNVDEYVRNTTARAFAVVASALGIHALLPFLKAVCQSKRSWQARHTGIKIVQQISILMGCAVLPHLKNLVEIIEHGLEDDQSKVRCITALALAALAEASAPFGIESFDGVIKPLWKGIRLHRGKTLGAFLKAIGYIIPLMDSNFANYFTKQVMPTLIREFASPDEEMKKYVLKVVEQCVGTDGVEPEFVRTDVLPPFFSNFWIRRMAMDRKNYRQLVETTCQLANKVGGGEVIGKIVVELKDENEPFRRMVLETIEKILTKLGASDVDPKLEELLIDGILFSFQEQSSDDNRVMIGFGVVVNSLGARVTHYLPQIAGIIKFRLNNKAPRIRQQAADLIAKIAAVMKACGKEQLLCHLGVTLYEYLGEEYPEVLGSILGALKAVVNVIGMTNMTPPIKDLLPRLTPILKNRHEKVQENCIDLVGRIADRGAEHVAQKEWIRICFQLIELLNAHKKGIRRAAVNTFGYIAKAIGPQDVLAPLLENLKVQERQNRVCTTVAIAIVAETCSPFTVLPSLMNEYTVPELNVQNGVLKSLSFLFEYIGELGKDYVYAVTPLLEDALMDKDPIHRQTAAWVVKHMALGVTGLGREDAIQHLMNYVWPNIFENGTHIAQATQDAIDGFRMALGPVRLLQYVLQGLFHPARKVRTTYWKIYNTLYIGHQDALVAAYPRIENDVDNTYRRYHLEAFI